MLANVAGDTVMPRGRSPHHLQSGGADPLTRGLRRGRTRAITGPAAMLLFLFLSFPAYAFDLLPSQPGTLTLEGYYKNLFLTSKRFAGGSWYAGDLNRVRLDLGVEPLDWLRFQVVWDNEWTGGDYVASEAFALRQATRNAPYLNMDYALVQEHNFFYGQGFYRALLKVENDYFELTLGRQRVAWGTTRLLSPNDLFTPLTVFEVEKLEKVGVDAAHVRIPFGATSSVQLVHVVREDFDQARTAARVTHTVGRFDLSMQGGRFARDVIIGFDFSGEFLGVGWRGDISYQLADQGDNFFQVAFGGDYAWPNTFYLLVEYFYNGQADQATPAQGPLFFPGAQPIKTQNSHFLGMQLSYEFTPLLKSELYTIVDLAGPSAFVNPELRYGLLKWLDLTAGLQLFFGGAGAEFTTLPHIYYLEAKAFF